ncbi:thioredoxin family protein [Planctomycetota bacterium]|nr:thioredoxin family protein [Planctomycetota bacterium]
MKSPLIWVLCLSILTLSLTPALIAAPADDATAELENGLPWVMDIEVAKEMAKKEGKDILINFTGSDWCGWCKKLDAEVFNLAAFDETAGKQFIYLYLDFPQGEEPKAKVISPEMNDKHREEMGINGYPTIMLADAQMRPYGRTGYVPGGPEAYLKNLEELRTAGDKLKKMLAMEDGSVPPAMFIEVFSVMSKNELLGYPGYSKFLDIAEKSDNEELQKVVANHKASKRLQDLLNTQEPDFPALVKFLQENKDLGGPECLNALWFCQQWLAGEDRKEEARAFLTRMLNDPLVAENPQGQKMIQGAIEAMDHAEGNHDHDGDGVPDH